MTDPVKSAPSQLDPVVIEALRGLRSRVYGRDRLWAVIVTWRSRRWHPVEKRVKDLTGGYARAATIHTFKHLKHHGYRWDVDQIRGWAATHRWKPQDVDRLTEYAAGVLAGTRYHTQPDPVGRLAIERWRARARSSFPGDGPK